MTNLSNAYKKNEGVFLSIVIPSYNSEQWIVHCLDSIKNQVQRDDVEVIVVDSSEKDLTPFVIERYPFVKVYHLPERAYPGTARTYGIQRSHGNVIAFIDTDCKANDEWVEGIINEQIRGRNVVGGPVENGTPKSLVGISEYILEFSELVSSMPEGEVRFIPTCNISFKRYLFDRIGKIEDTIKGSDVLFCRKITLLGEPIYFIRSLTVSHSNRTSLKKYLKNQYEIGFGAAQVRKIESQLGSILVEYPILIPLIPFARSLMIGKRFLRYDRKLFLKFIGLYPLIFLGMVVYTTGFWHGRIK